MRCPPRPATVVNKDSWPHLPGLHSFLQGLTQPMSMSHSSSKPTCIVGRQSKQYRVSPPSPHPTPQTAPLHLSSTAWRSKLPLSLRAPGRSPSKLAHERVNKKEPSQYRHLCSDSGADSMSGLPGLSPSLQAAKHTSLARSLPKSIAPSSRRRAVNARKGQNASPWRDMEDNSMGLRML